MNDPVIIIVIASASGLCALFAKLCYSSRCTHVSGCGIDIVRDTINEQVINIGNATPIHPSSHGHGHGHHANINV